MSIEALNWALGHMQRDDIESSTAFVLMILANRADPEGICWPSVKYICARTKLADSTVRGACRRLRDMELLQIDEQARADGGKATNRYKLCITTPPPPVVGGTPPPHIGDAHHRQTAVPPPATGGLKTKEETSLPDGREVRPRATKKFPIPDDFTVSAEVQKWSEEHGLLASYVGQQLEAFRDDARANRRLHADWDAAFKGWMRRQPNFDRTAPRPTRGARTQQRPDFEMRCYVGRGTPAHCTATTGLTRVGPSTMCCQGHLNEHYTSMRQGPEAETRH